MKTLHFDFAVIGGGSAGFAAALAARETCERVAIIEAAEELGGLCVLRGCMPSKALIYSSDLLHLAQRASEFGLVIPEARADMVAIQQRKEALIDHFATYRREQLNSDRFTLIRERARFVSERAILLESTGRRLTADCFMIATGSVVNVPPVPGLADTPHWTSDDVLKLREIPRSIIVLGGGAIACELAQFLRRVGSRVILIQRNKRLLKDASSEAAAAVAHAFESEGIELYTNTDLLEVCQEKSGIVVRFDHGGKACEVVAEHLLNALGRKPSTGNLGLEDAGVKVSESKHVEVDNFQRSSNSIIYAGGDVTGPYDVVHLAAMQGVVAAKHAMGQPVQPISYALRTRVIFTSPEVATVGVSLAEAKQSGIQTIVASRAYKDHGKAILMGAKDGYAKIWADTQTGKVLGAECVGKDAGELIHSMAVAIALGATPSSLLDVQWYHPTLSDIWSESLQELAAKCV